MPPTLALRQLSHPPDVLHALDLVVDAGERIAIRGHNGSGKTTLIKLIAGVWRIRSGEALICGHAAGTVQARRSIAWMPDQPIMPAMPVRHVLQMAAAAHRVSPSLAMAHLKDLGGQDLLTHRADRLSLGQRRRVALAAALAGRPALVIADEPLANFDAEGMRSVRATLLPLAQAGCAIVYSCPTGGPLLDPNDAVYELINGKLARYA